MYITLCQLIYASKMFYFQFKKTSSLAKGYYPPPLLLTHGSISCNFIIPGHCPLLDFVYYHFQSISTWH